ncbi:MAG: FkbM family methyltransferase [Planctomycetota bacterium]|nr:FkbM family methyltransferase [Planctomycetota bacterium]
MAKVDLPALLSEDVEAARRREAAAFDAVAQGGGIVLFGAGNLGRMTLRGLRKAGVQPLAFADNDRRKWGQTSEGLPVLAPEEAARRYGAGAAFVVCVWNATGTHRYVKSLAQLRGLGCARVCSFQHLYWKHPEALLPYLLYDLPHKVLEKREAVRAAADLWHDEASRGEYLAQVAWRLTGDFSLLPEPLACLDYEPPGVYRMLPEEVFVDCGAYIGDTLDSLFVKQGRPFRAYHAMEPDPGTFAKLNASVAALAPEIRARVVTHDLAASSHWHEASFSADGSEAAALSAQGNVRVRCGPLDEALKDAAPTFIKMDIEGAEQDALKGAANLIRKHRPVLAICVYHKQSDLWEIPLLIRSISADYRFFLRPHLPEGMQSVCYAVPDGRLAG